MIMPWNIPIKRNSSQWWKTIKQPWSPTAVAWQYAYSVLETLSDSLFLIFVFLLVLHTIIFAVVHCTTVSKHVGKNIF